MLIPAMSVMKELMNWQRRAQPWRPWAPPPFIPVPLSLIRRETKLAIKKSWTKSWTDRIDCRQTRKFFPRPCAKRSRELFKLQRPAFSRMGRLLTGHDFLRKHEAITSEEPQSKICRLCKSDTESSWHILMECDALGAKRFNALGLHRLTDPPDKFSNFIRWATSEHIAGLEDTDEAGPT